MPGLSQAFVEVMYAITFVLVVSIATSAIWVVILKKWSRRLGLVDCPDDHRKLHDSAMPVIGGVAVFIATAFSLTLSNLFFPDLWAQYAGNVRELVGLGLASTFLVLIGVLDDRFGIRGRQKLASQIIAAGILVVFGFTFDSIRMFGVEIELGYLTIPLAMIWLLAAINSVNLIDGADGIASIVGIIIGVSLTLTAIWHERFIDAAIATALTGALVAFLYFNLPPASAFLGDAGSMLIGLVFGAIAIRCSFKETFAYSFAAPVAILAIPFFDASVAILRRVLTGRSIYTTDRGHLHHTLLRRGMSQRRMLATFAGLTLITAVCGTLCVYTRQESIAVFGVGFVFAILISFRIFGFSEFQLLRNRSRSFIQSILTFKSLKKAAPESNSTRLQGSGDWETYWTELTEFAVRHNLTSVCLDIDLPWQHEGFHAKWKQKNVLDPVRQWQTRFPLIAGARCCGRIEASGPTPDAAYLETVEALTEKAYDFEEAVSRIIVDHSQVDTVVMEAVELPDSDTSFPLTNESLKNESAATIQ